MLRNLPKILTAFLLSLFLAVSHALFPANGGYYETLMQGLDIRGGASPASMGWIERIHSVAIASVWNIAGNIGVRFFVALLAFFVSFGVIVFLFWLTAFISQKITRPPFSRLALGTGWILVLLFAFYQGIGLLQNWSFTDARLLAPLDLVKFAENQKADTVFYNPYARRYVRPLHAEWIPKEETSWRQAAGDPALWRQLDRSKRFDLVLLSGPTAEFQPLLDHLQSSPDWQLAYLDNGGMAFARKTEKNNEVPLPGDFTERYRNGHSQAVALAQAAMQCAILQDYDAANDLLNKSLKIDKECAEAYSVQALISLQRKNWEQAIRHANEALERDPGLLVAMQVKTQALLENKERQQAYSLSREIIERNPRDFYSLLLHARIANEAHAYSSESNALEKAIAIAEKSGFPTGAYHVFLGQSYAKQGRGPQAIEQLEAALNDPTLSQAQKKQIRDSLRIVQQRSGLTP